VYTFRFGPPVAFIIRPTVLQSLIHATHQLGSMIQAPTVKIPKTVDAAHEDRYAAVVKTQLRRL